MKNQGHQYAHFNLYRNHTHATGKCGGCWAFAATETVEAAWALSRNQPVGNGQLSVEQILGCDTTNGVYGCDGGYIFEALLWVWSSSNGLVSEATDPFTCVNNCPNPPSCPGLGGIRAAYITFTCSCSYAGNEASMMSALFKV